MCLRERAAFGPKREISNVLIRLRIRVRSNPLKTPDRALDLALHRWPPERARILPQSFRPLGSVCVIRLAQIPRTRLVRKRIAALSDEPDRLTATVMFAPLEQSVRLFGYAPRRPTVTAQSGSAGEVAFDKRTGRFEVLVSPSPEQLHEEPAGDPVRQALISLPSR
jgi:hypothetical protein